MGWAESGIARRQNIANLLDTITRRAQAEKDRQEQAKQRRWGMVGNLANMGLDVWGTLSGRKYGTQERREGEQFEASQSALDRGAEDKRNRNKAALDIILHRTEMGQKGREHRESLASNQRVAETYANAKSIPGPESPADRDARLKQSRAEAVGWWQNGLFSKYQGVTKEKSPVLGMNQYTQEPEVNYKLLEPEDWDNLRKEFRKIPGIDEVTISDWIRSMSPYAPEAVADDDTDIPKIEETVAGEVPRSAPGLSISQQADVIKARAKKLLSSAGDPFLKRAVGDYIKNITETQGRLNEARLYPNRGGNARAEEDKLNQLLMAVSELIDKYAPAGSSPRERVQGGSLWGRGKR